MQRTAAPGELMARRGRPRGGGDGGGQARGDSAVQFSVATAADDAALRRLARENPMQGQISLSFEREPSYFAAAAIEGPEHHTIVATENGRIICAGSVSARLRFINGQPVRVGYLGGLRLDASARNRTYVIRRGYEMFHRLHLEQGGPPLYLTSIVADNLPARRLLERGLPGMPTYRFLGEFITLVIRRRRRRRAPAPFSGVPAGSLTVPHALLARHQPQYQFAPVWTLEGLQSSGLAPDDFCVAHSSDGAPIACAALWDQHCMKQTVVRGYAPRLRALRPLINVAATLLGRPRLPAVGRAVSHAFVSHLATDPDQPNVTETLIRLLQRSARTRGIDYLTLGFDVRDPRLPNLRRALRPREYVSRLYAVHWDDGADLVRQLDDRFLAPEVALL
jgi:hypothetical protein